ncbi:MAG: DUF2497 domain-containing protein [Alphaproteobacteria bacterium]|nr:DUF2497 domain-containing protein [Alphaproteobacteria bacterium]
MSEPKSQQEPSMEEILASIRRIISEDGTPEDGAQDAAAAAPAPSEEPEDAESSAEAEAVAPAEPDEDDVLELTEIAEEAGEEDDQDSVGGMFDSTPEPETEAEADYEPESGSAPVSAPPAASAGGGLLSAAAASAAESQLSSLVAAVGQAQGGTPIGAGNRTIEDLVKEVMRPMIKQWLDAHLPALTERIVRREVERLARRADADD